MESVLDNIPHLLLLEGDFNYMDVAIEVNKMIDGVGDTPLVGMGTIIYVDEAGDANHRHFIDLLRQKSFACIFCGGEFDVLPTKEVYLAHYAKCFSHARYGPSFRV